MKVGGHEDIVPKEDDGEYKWADTFLSFHREAEKPISQKALLAGFLSAWLKRCVILSLPHDGITPSVILPTI